MKAKHIGTNSVAVVVVLGLLGGCSSDPVTGNQNNNNNNNGASPVCGDSVIDPGEDCDGTALDGETCQDRGYDSGTLSCAANCTFDESGCFDGSECGDGNVDGDEVCDDGNTVSGDGCAADCLSDETCGNGVLDVAAGETCDDGNTVGGDGCGASCSLEFCGNGVLDANEICDDGNSVGGDGCSADCQSDETCGNGYVDTAAGEVCDDGNTNAGDGCGPTCLLESCGNGVDDPGEVCDDGNNTSGDGCSADCQSNETCGNGYVDNAVGEGCDDGNMVGGDGCSPVCQVEVCGNSVVDTGEMCDDGNTVGGDGCSANCQSNETCGNGVIDPAELCDDGNNAGGDGCSADCQSDETCGNGIMDVAAGEGCDDGNTSAGDGCSALCQLEICGNGVIDPAEVCDDGNTAGGDGCSADCQSDETCGNSILDLAAGETCDDGNTTPGDGCSANCLIEGCGNGIIEAPEVCDDNNTISGDGCSSDCLSDETCGNGYVDNVTGEACDDGNLNPGDGCGPTCQLETCGNGVLDPGEVCDDNNTVGGDGCSADCLSDETCGNGFLDVLQGEACDDGNTSGGDGCNATCQHESCGDAVDVTGQAFPYQRTGTYSADPAAGGSCDTTPNNAVYFTYTAPATSLYRFDLANSSTTIAYSRLAIFETTACNPYGAEVACNTATSRNISNTVQLTAAASYLIMFYTDGEIYTMVDPEITIAPVVPGPGDTCADAIDVTPSTFPHTEVGTFDLEQDPGGSCDVAANNMVFFTYTAMATGWFEIDLENGNTGATGSRVAVFETTACSPYGAELVCETSAGSSLSTQVLLTMGQSYLIVFYTSSENSAMTDPEISITPFVPGAGETCATSEDVSGATFPYQLTGTFDLEQDPGGSCDPVANNMVFFSYSPTVTNWYRIDLVNNTTTNAYSRLAVFQGTGCLPYGPEQTCVTNNSKTAIVNLQLTAGQSYLIVFYTDGETYTMVDPEITIGPGTPPPDGADCSNPADAASTNYYVGGGGEDCWSWTAIPSDTTNSHNFTCDSFVGGDVVVEYTTGAAQTSLNWDASIANFDTDGYIGIEVTDSPCPSGSSAYCFATFGTTTDVNTVAVIPSTTYYIWVADAFSVHHLPDVDICLW